MTEFQQNTIPKTGGLAHGEPNFMLVNPHEFVNGIKTPIVDKFMKYNSYEENI